MGFALGGVFGLFMASVCGAALIYTPTPTDSDIDVLRLRINATRASYCKPASQGAITEGLQGHGPAVLELSQELRQSRRHLRGD